MSHAFTAPYAFRAQQAKSRELFEAMMKDRKAKASAAKALADLAAAVDAIPRR